MKIAVFHELHTGGARRAANEYVKRLKAHHVVDLYFVDENEEKDAQLPAKNIFFYKFSPKKWRGKNWKIRIYKDSLELYSLYKLHKKIAKAINAKEYDLAFIHPSRFTQAPFILRFLKVKKIYYCQEPLRFAYESEFAIKNVGPLKRIYDSATRRVRKEIDVTNIHKADVALANSNHSQKNIQNAYGIKSTVSYLGVDTSLFSPIKTEKKYDILFLGATDEIDGYPLLEEALSLMKIKPIVKVQISGLQWALSDQALSKLYSQSKIVVCFAHNEPFGLIPLEAMACGVPVVAVNEGGYKETIRNGETGYLVPRDAKMLAEKLMMLLSRPKIAKKMGENARRYVLDQWTWEKSEKYLEDLLTAYAKK